MRLSSQVAKAESELDNVLLWFECQKLAKEYGEPAEEIYADARSTADKYSHLARTLPSGRVDIEPVLRAVAEADDLDYNELVTEVRRLMRQQRARGRRQRK